MRKYTVESFQNEPFATIDNHIMAAGLDRLVAKSIPLHCALHKVDIAENQAVYSLPHRHSDEDELNIIINDQGHELKYQFVIDDETFELSAPSCVWIPAGTDHKANVIGGRGTFVCMRFKAAPDS